MFYPPSLGACVEYCSYKGLTLNNNLFNKLINLFVEYCSYKGLTLKSLPLFLDSP